MKFFKDMSIRERSIIGFLVIALSVAGVGAIGYLATDKAYKAAETVYREKVPIVEAAMSASGAIIAGKNIMAEYIIHEKLEDREKYRQEFNRLMDEYHMWHHAAIMGTDSEDFKTNYGDIWSQKHGDKFVVPVAPDSEVKEKFNKAEGYFEEFQSASQALMLAHDSRLTRESEKNKLVKELKNSRKHLQNIILGSDDAQLKLDFMTMKYESKEYIFQYMDEKHEKEWLDSIATMKATIALSSLDEETKNDLQKDLIKYESTANQVIVIVEEIDKLKAEELSHMASLDAAGVKVEEVMSSVVDISTGEMDIAIASAKETKSTSNVLVVLVTIVAIALALGIGRLLADSVTKPLQDLHDGANRIAKGDLTRDIVARTKDEVGALAKTFKEMTESLRGLVSQVQQSAKRVAATSQELAASSQEVASTTSQVSSTVQQIATGALSQSQKADAAKGEIDHMAEMVYRISNKAQEAADISRNVGETAKAGGTAAKQATAKMNEIHVVVNDSAKLVKELGERSQRIGEIVDVITNIAEQTNLLALNAAIEAARAGEHGRGFAVVAEEVRKLAENSALAAEEISGLIKTIQSETSKAVESMDYGAKGVADGANVVTKALTSLEEIAGAVDSTIASVHEISEATQELSSITDTIVRTMEEITAKAEEAAAGTEEASAATEEQASSMDEISSLAQELADLAGQLQEATSRFKLNGNGQLKTRNEAGTGDAEPGKASMSLGKPVVEIKASKAGPTAQDGGTKVNQKQG